MGYKIVESILDFLDDNTRYLRYKLFDIRLWFRYRTTERYNVIKIKTLEPGFYEARELLLHASMQIVVDFVEVNKANMMNGVGRAGTGWKRWIPRLLRPILFRRSRELGLQYLDWEICLPRENVLDSDGNVEEYACLGQAECAETLKEIYLWWKDVYPNREDPMDASGLSEWYDYERDRYGDIFRTEPCAWDENGKPTVFRLKDDLSEEEEKKKDELHRKCWKIEEEYYQEEEEMLIKLAKIRLGLWT